MDIEKVAAETPDKIITNKISLKDSGPSNDEVEKVINIFKFNAVQKEVAKMLIKSLYKLIIEKDANLIEINALILPKKIKLCVLMQK